MKESKAFYVNLPQDIPKILKRIEDKYGKENLIDNLYKYENANDYVSDKNDERGLFTPTFRQLKNCFRFLDLFALSMFIFTCLSFHIRGGKSLSNGSLSSFDCQSLSQSVPLFFTSM